MYITNIKNGPERLKTGYGKINKVKKFSYLSEIIQLSKSENEADQIHLTRNVYNKKPISTTGKLTHYKAVIKSEWLYVAEFEHRQYWGQQEMEKRRKVFQKTLSSSKQKDNID